MGHPAGPVLIGSAEGAPGFALAGQPRRLSPHESRDSQRKKKQSCRIPLPRGIIFGNVS